MFTQEQMQNFQEYVWNQGSKTKEQRSKKVNREVCYKVKKQIRGMLTSKQARKQASRKAASKDTWRQVQVEKQEGNFRIIVTMKAIIYP